MLDLALVGTGGTMPLPGRWLSSVLIRYAQHLILFDCGEGTQISLRQLGWGLKDIGLILISHVHGDHVLGLPGLLLTLANSGRTEPIDILGPVGLTETVAHLRVAAPRLPFEVRCRDFAPGDVFRLQDLGVSAAYGEHHVACLGFRLDLPRSRAFDPTRARQLHIPLEYWKRLQAEESVGGFQPDDVLGPPRKGLAVTLLTDTRPTVALETLARDVDLLICEGMFGDDADQPRAVDRKHMTFAEAAQLARNAGAQRLVLTHFSPSLTNPHAYAANATRIFANTQIGEDHLAMSLKFSD